MVKEIIEESIGKVQQDLIKANRIENGIVEPVEPITPNERPFEIDRAYTIADLFKEDKQEDEAKEQKQEMGLNEAVEDSQSTGKITLSSDGNKVWQEVDGKIKTFSLDRFLFDLLKETDFNTNSKEWEFLIDFIPYTDMHTVYIAAIKDTFDKDDIEYKLNKIEAPKEFKDIVFRNMEI